MIKRHPIPSKETLETLFKYDANNGILFWKKRPLGHFVNETAYKKWNTRYSSKAAGCIDKNGAIVIRCDGKIYFAHRLIYKIETGLEPLILDHIDQNIGNNRIENLREADDSKNASNTGKRPHNTSGYKGVIWDNHSKKWVARVGHMYKVYSGGYHNTREDAFEAACELRRKLHGEFACDGV